MNNFSVIGLGGCGCNLVNRYENIESERLYGISDKATCLSLCKADEENKMLLDEQADLETFLGKIPSELLIFVSGLGGSNSKYLSRIISVAKRANKKVIVLGYLPFRFEARQRRNDAHKMWDMLINSDEIDRVIFFNNNQLLNLATRETSVSEALALADVISREVINSISKNPSGLNYDIKCYRSGELRIEDCVDFTVIVNSSKFGMIYVKLE